MKAEEMKRICENGDLTHEIAIDLAEEAVRLQKQRDEALRDRKDWMKACKGYKQDLEQVQHENKHFKELLQIDTDELLQAHQENERLRQENEELRQDRDEWKDCAKTRLENIKECNKCYRSVVKERDEWKHRAEHVRQAEDIREIGRLRNRLQLILTKSVVPFDEKPNIDPYDVIMDMGTLAEEALKEAEPNETRA